MNKNDKSENKTGEPKKPKTTGNKLREKIRQSREESSVIIHLIWFSWNSKCHYDKIKVMDRNLYMGFIVVRTCDVNAHTVELKLNDVNFTKVYSNKTVCSK